jgi:serine/threonine protein kinase
MSDRLGQQLGNYRLVKLLGKGGFAEVYLGQHVRLAAKQAAIKLLHLSDVDARKFQEEAETTEKLVHPHIVRLLDFALEQDTPFLVLDYAPGGSLRIRHPKGSIVPLATVAAYLKDLVPALQYAHDQHILHRDIKPDNMLIGRQGELLLSDFGVAVLTQTGRTTLSSAYDVGGTPYYMAPEMFRGKPEKASDQYSLAVVVYEWLFGSVPFTEGNFIQLGFQHAHEPVPPLREKNPAIPPAVEAVVMKALAKEPKDRFASVQAFATAFEQACTPTLAAEKSHRDQGRQTSQAEQEHLQAEEERVRQEREERARQAKEKWERLRSPSVAVVSILLILLVLGAGIYWVTGNLSSNAHQPRTIATAQASAGVSGRTWHAQTSGTSHGLYGVVWSGSQFVAVGVGGTIRTSPDGHTWAAQNAGTSPLLECVAWSGSQFVAVGSKSTILTSPDGRTWTAQNAGTSRRLVGVAWSSLLFVAVGDNGTVLTSPDGRTWTAQNAGTSQLLYSVVWSGSQFVAVGNAGTIVTSP